MSIKDLPDYTRQMVIKYDGGFVGLEELAARLGFIGPGDLRGNIILAENFESELTDWLDVSSGGTSSAVRSSRHKFSGDWSVKLYTANVAGAHATLERQFHFPGLSKYALFTRLCWNDAVDYIGFYAYFNGDGKEYYIDVSYSPHEATLRLYDSSGGYRVLGYPVIENTNIYLWVPLMITFDLATGKYDKLYLGDQEYDISAYSLDVANWTGTDLGQIDIYTERTYNAEFTGYVDDIILVKNIP